MGVTYSQFFPPTPTLTEVNLPSQKGKVFLVTGGYSGIGLELCTILYQAGGKVYLAGRSEKKARAAIIKVIKSSGSSDGDIVFLPMSLDDLTTIKPAIETFIAAESRLDVLFNNAGVSNPPRGSVSHQGYELQLATNCLGPYLLTQLLVPTLKRTAQTVAPATVRVIWTSSIVTDLSAPIGGLKVSDLKKPHSNPQHNYVTSKVGNWFLADALATQAGPSGILSLVQNPGNLKTDLTRHLSYIVPLLAAPLLYPARLGAYTALWAAFSGDLNLSNGGNYVLPWGRLHPSPRPDLLQAMKGEGEGGTGIAAAFVQYCEEQTSLFR